MSLELVCEGGKGKPPDTEMSGVGGVNSRWGEQQVGFRGECPDSKEVSPSSRQLQSFDLVSRIGTTLVLAQPLPTTSKSLMTKSLKEAIDAEIDALFQWR